MREEKIDQISDLRDESDRRGMSIVIELKRGAQPKKVLNQLYKYTALQTTFGVQMLALVDGEPRTLPLKGPCRSSSSTARRSSPAARQFDLDKARARAAHPGRLPDRPGQPGRRDPDHPRNRRMPTRPRNLIKRFKLSEIQAQAILDMQLRRLAALERQKIEEEHKQVAEQIAHLEDLLANPKKILALIQDECANWPRSTVTSAAPASPRKPPKN